MMSDLAAAHRAFIQAESKFHCDVYRESPEWNKVERWWQLPADVLRELFVERWECDEYDAWDLVAELKRKYPDHVLVHCL